MVVCEQTALAVAPLTYQFGGAAGARYLVPRCHPMRRREELKAVRRLEAIDQLGHPVEPLEGRGVVAKERLRLRVRVSKEMDCACSRPVAEACHEVAL